MDIKETRASKVDSTLRECFTYEYIIFKFAKSIIYNTITILSFEPIPYKAVEQIKKDLGEYIKNENC